MFTVMLLIAFQRGGSTSQLASPVYEVPSLTWSRETDIIVSDHQCPSRRIVPGWKSAWIDLEHNLLKDQSHYEYLESNLEQWEHLAQTVKIEELPPQQAIEKRKEEGIIVSCVYDSDPMTPHCPWHPGIQQPWPKFLGIGSYLHYELVNTPSTQKPYYEAVVCSMPTLRCKAKTIELLQKQLLQQYANYLETLQKPKVFERASWIGNMPFQSKNETTKMQYQGLKSSRELSRQSWVQVGY